MFLPVLLSGQAGDQAGHIEEGVVSYRYAVILIFTAIFVAFTAPGTAFAADFTTPWHQHDKLHSYYLSTSLPSAWRPAIKEAGKASMPLL